MVGIGEVRALFHENFCTNWLILQCATSCNSRWPFKSSSVNPFETNSFDQDEFAPIMMIIESRDEICELFRIPDPFASLHHIFQLVASGAYYSWSPTFKLWSREYKGVLLRDGGSIKRPSCTTETTHPIRSRWEEPHNSRTWMPHNSSLVALRGRESRTLSYGVPINVTNAHYNVHWSKRKKTTLNA